MMVMMVMVTTRKGNGDGNDAEVVITKRNGIDDGDDDGDGDNDDGDDDEYDDLWRFPFRDHRGAPGGVGTP